MTKTCRAGKCTVLESGEHTGPGCGCDCHKPPMPPERKEKEVVLPAYWWLKEETGTLMRMANRLYRSAEPLGSAAHDTAAALEMVLLNRGYKPDQYLCVGGPGCKDFHWEGNSHE